MSHFNLLSSHPYVSAILVNLRIARLSLTFEPHIDRLFVASDKTQSYCHINQSS